MYQVNITPEKITVINGIDDNEVKPVQDLQPATAEALRNFLLCLTSESEVLTSTTAIKH